MGKGKGRRVAQTKKKAIMKPSLSDVEKEGGVGGSRGRKKNPLGWSNTTHTPKRERERERERSVFCPFPLFPIYRRDDPVDI